MPVKIGAIAVHRCQAWMVYNANMRRRRQTDADGDDAASSSVSTGILNTTRVVCLGKRKHVDGPDHSGGFLKARNISHQQQELSLFLPLFQALVRITS